MINDGRAPCLATRRPDTGAMTIVASAIGSM
jgi:hypothetical protein